MIGKRYTTRQDAIEREIIPALGDRAGDYDVEAIAEESFKHNIDTDEAGNELLNTAGFEQIVSDDEFWKIVEKHDRSTVAESSD